MKVFLPVIAAAALAAVAATPETKMAELMFVRSSNGMTIRQPAAAPIRSKAYSRPMAPPHRVRAVVTTMPERVKGTPNATVNAATDRTSITEMSVSGRNGISSVAACDRGMDHAKANVARASASGARSREKRSGRRKT